MGDDEIEELIAAVSSLLDANGFGWAREQAEAGLDPRWHRRWLARALIDASESVTVDLAQAELDVLSTFGADDVHFKPDDGADPDGDAFVTSESTQVAKTIETLNGPERRETLQRLAGMRLEFQILREQLNDGA
tara:strand:- start:7886 stop:8287 length:402 start_codon:yes stop_codon:yes gene_type:complete